MKDYASKLATLQQELETYKTQRTQIITTGQSWQLRNGEDNRSLTNVSLAQLNALIAETERKIAELEDVVTYGANPKGIRVRASAI